ncbi:MAG: T9SS type A sorting domain-containing protein [Chitinophagales bacterium]|nr:T9SS type A sorting domain-containing protein [Chitinophagales bacterium]
MKQKLLIFIFLLLFSSLQAQEVPKNILVEHFTNSLCSICANKNPGFYNTIEPYDKVIHIAYHPSSPYAACVFSQHNPTENDDRTNYYNLYGGTPRLVVNGEVLAASSNLISNPILDAQNNLSSAFEIQIEQFQYSSDSMYSEITISKKAASSENLAELYVLLSEKEIAYSSPNGEDIHHDVFRKFLLQDEQFNLPSVGNETSILVGSKIDQDWQAKELTTTVFLQNSSSKEIIQAEQSDKLNFTTSIALNKLIDKAIYPNPTKDFLYVNNDKLLLQKIEIYSIIGTLVHEENLEDRLRAKIDAQEFGEGNYILRIYAKNKEVYAKKIVIDY